MPLFPESFMWGATTSSHQVEGDNFRNDWWKWEQRPGRILSSDVSKVAAGHATRYQPDFQLARKLGHTAHLLSIEWSRVEPEEGAFDPEGLNHYRQVLQTLVDLGISPVVALHHVTIPLWLAERGGWKNPAAPAYFARYAEHVHGGIGAWCRWWIPILEPVRTVGHAYVNGSWPPQERSWRGAWRVLRHMASAHARVYDAIHNANPGARVGAHIRARVFDPLDDTSAWDLRAARRETHRRTDVFLDALLTGRWPRTALVAPTSASDFDFLALASDSRGVVRFDWRATHRFFVREVSHGDHAASGAELYDSLNHFIRYQRPLLIAGDGIATNDDTERCTLLAEHLSVLLDALDAGTPVLGYFHRALLDGFEWTRGYSARYGLIHVDRASLARTPNPSAYLYRDIIESRQVRPGVVSRYAPK